MRMTLTSQHRFLLAAGLTAAFLAGCGAQGQRSAQSEHKAGSASRNGVPDWFPIYSGGGVSKVEIRKAGIETYTEFRLEAPADCEKVANWYDEKLKLAGFDLRKFISRTSGCDGTLAGDGPRRQRSIGMSGGNSDNQGRSSWFAVTAVEREVAGQVDGSPSGNVRIPEWVPQYPNSTPSKPVQGEAGGGRSFDFSFVTGDDVRRVFDWYEQKLKA